MKFFGTCLVIVLLINLNPARAQFVNEWKVTGADDYTGCWAYNNLKITEKKYVAILCNDIEPPAISTDSLNLLLLSVNAGKSWEIGLKDKVTNIDTNYLPLPGDWQFRWYTAVEMPSKNLILLLGLECLKNKTGYFPFLQRSTDFGKSWERISISNYTLNCHSSRISMSNENKGILFTGRKPTKEDTANVALYKTTDGGLTWAEINTGNSINLSTFYWNIKAFSENKYVLVSKSGIMETEDGGTTWSRKNFPFGKEEAYSDISYQDENTWYIACVGPSTGLGDTRFNVLYKTTDGGDSWKKIMDNKDPLDFGLEGVSFHDELNGIVLTDNNILMTSDGGNTWDIQTLPFDSYNERYSKAIFYDTDKAIVSGNRILVFDGNNALAPPKANYIKEDNELLNYSAHWNNVYGESNTKADNYIFQIAEYDKFLYPPYYPEGFEQHILFEDNSLADTSINLNGKLHFGKDYYLRVKAISGIYESDWSRVLYFRTGKDTTTKPDLDSCYSLSPPEQATLPPTGIDFKWKAVKNAEKYSLIVVQPKNISSKDYDFKCDNLTETHKIIDTLLPNVVYLWWVIAEADGFNPSYSYYRYLNTEGFTTSAPWKNSYKSIENFFYPNPVETTLHFKVENKPSVGNIQIFSIEGKKVIETGFREKIDVSRLKAGVYFVTVGSLNGMFIKI